MTNECESCIATIDRNGFQYGTSLKRLGEAIGKTPEEMATLIRISVAEYDEREAFEGELNMVLNLAELSKLSSVLGIHTRLLFDGENLNAQLVSTHELMTKIRACLNSTCASVSEFEDRVGFKIEKSLSDPFEILKWNVDCLRFVCKETGVDWRLALP